MPSSLPGLTGYSDRIILTHLVSTRDNVQGDEQWWMADAESGTWETTLDIVWQEHDDNAATRAARITIGSTLTVYQTDERWASYRVTTLSLSGHRIAAHGTRINWAGSPQFLYDSEQSFETTVALHFTPPAADGEDAQESLPRTPGLFARMVATRPQDDAAFAAEATVAIQERVRRDVSPVAGDIVTLHTVTQSYRETREYTGSAWVWPQAMLTGDLLLTNSIPDSKIISVSATKLRGGLLTIGGGDHPTGMVIQDDANVVLRNASPRVVDRGACLIFQDHDGTRQAIVQYSPDESAILWRPHVSSNRHLHVGQTAHQWKTIRLDAETIVLGGRVQVTGSIGAEDLTATVTPASHVRRGADLTCAVTGGQTPYTYQCQQSTDQGVMWEDVIGETATTYTVPDVDASDHTSYRYVVEDATGTQVTSNVVRVAAPLSATLDPTFVTVTPGGGSTTRTVTCVVRGGTGDITYHWAFRPTAADQWVTRTSTTFQEQFTCVAGNEFLCRVTRGTETVTVRGLVLDMPLQSEESQNRGGWIRNANQTVTAHVGTHEWTVWQYAAHVTAVTTRLTVELVTNTVGTTVQVSGLTVYLTRVHPQAGEIVFLVYPWGGTTDESRGPGARVTINVS